MRSKFRLRNPRTARFTAWSRFLVCGCLFRLLNYHISQQIRINPSILDGETDWTINNELQVWSKHPIMSIWNRFHRTALRSQTRTSENGQSPWTLYSLTRKFTSFFQFFQVRNWYFDEYNFRRFVMQIQMKSCSYWHSFSPFLMVQMTKDRHITYIRNFSSIYPKGRCSGAI